MLCKYKPRKAERERIERFRAKYRGVTFYFPTLIGFDKARFKPLTKPNLRLVQGA